MTDREALLRLHDRVAAYTAQHIKPSRKGPLLEALAEARAALASGRAKPEFESESLCVEAEGCPTELAVLQRFWRSERAKRVEPVSTGRKND